VPSGAARSPFEGEDPVGAILLAGRKRQSRLASPTLKKRRYTYRFHIFYLSGIVIRMGQNSRAGSVESREIEPARTANNYQKTFSSDQPICVKKEAI